MAAKFRKIDPRIWTDEKFKRLDRDGKLLTLWLLTSTRLNRCGIVLWSPGLAAEETGIDRDHIDTVSKTVFDTMEWVYDTQSSTVFLPNWWRYNQPPNSKALIGALSDLHDVPRHNLKPHLVKACALLKLQLHEVYMRILDTVSDTVSAQEQEKEKENKQEQKQEKEQKQEQEREQNTFAARPRARAKQPPAVVPRPRNLVFDAIAEVTGLDPSLNGGLVGKVAAALGKAEPPYDAAEVREFGRRFWEICPWARSDNRQRPTPTELEKWISQLRAKPSTVVGSPNKLVQEVIENARLFLARGVS